PKSSRVCKKLQRQGQQYVAGQTRRRVRRLEKINDKRVISSAKHIHPILLPLVVSTIGARTDCTVACVAGVAVVCATCVKAAITIATTTRPAATIPGSAYFQRNGIGGGVAASRRTASMTRLTKPDDGTIS